MCVDKIVHDTPTHSNTSMRAHGFSFFFAFAFVFVVTGEKGFSCSCVMEAESKCVSMETVLPSLHTRTIFESLSLLESLKKCVVVEATT